MKPIDPIDAFKTECIERASKYPDSPIAKAAQDFMLHSTEPKYSYNFSWLGRPIIQYPQDIVAMQELIWSIQPDLIIETGIAHGGSLIFSASMLELLATCGGCQDSYVLGVDIDIRPHNKNAILEHPMAKRIQMIQGSSIDEDIVKQVSQHATGKSKVLVCLDSNHTHDHVLRELQAYAPMTSVGSYCIVFDTIIEDLPNSMYPDRTWGPGDNPKTAVWKYLESHPEFSIDHTVDDKLLISVAPSGYLKRIS